MGVLLLTLISVLLFAVSANGLIRSLTDTVSFDGFQNYSLRARKMERFYKIVAWSLLTLLLFVSMLRSFIETFQQIP